MKALNASSDATYTSVNLSIFAIAEVFVGAFTACLPPLRKTFENLLHKALPAGLTGSSKNTRNSYVLKGMGSQQSAKSARLKQESDGDSERGILPEDQMSTRKGSDHVIMKTTLVSVTADDDVSTSRHGQDDWV